MVLDDKSIVCKDCADTFVFTTGEQGFYLEKGLLNEPQRCPDCREKRRLERAAGVRETTDVVCADCGDQTTVPFVPRLNRPVYCSDCFQRARGVRVAEPATV
ncbi:MAG: zinc-ribbon domain containing protein [Dehalococcoidia bacterium]